MNRSGGAYFLQMIRNLLLFRLFRRCRLHLLSAQLINLGVGFEERGGFLAFLDVLRGDKYIFW